MSRQNLERKELYYHIDLPLEESLQFGKQIEDMVWQIAKEEGVIDKLRESQLSISVGKPAIDVGTAITVVVTYLGTKMLDEITGRAIDKILDETAEIWKSKILPRVKTQFGRDILVEIDQDRS